MPEKKVKNTKTKAETVAKEIQDSIMKVKTLAYAQKAKFFPRRLDLDPPILRI